MTESRSFTASQAWWLAARPRTLPVSAAPVVLGTAVAWAGDRSRWGPALGALLGALCLQLASNFANDLFDFEKGADNDDRIGPPRASQLGLLSPSAMRWGIGAAVAGAVLCGLYLTAQAGWPVVAVGLVSILAALAYTGGPWPFGYKGLGDLAVFIFFGPVAVVGTDYVQSLQISPETLWASLPIGFLSTAILVVNNVRDIDSDRAAGKRTLAVRLGRSGGRLEYLLLVAVSFALLPLFWLAMGRSVWILLPFLLVGKAASLVRTLYSVTAGPALNAALGGTAQLLLGFALLMAVGWLM